MKRILVIRLSSFGDIILSFPLLKKLREKFPESEIDFLTKKNYEAIVLLNPHVNRVLTLEESLNESRRKVKSEKYDLILDIHKNFRSLFVSLFNGRKIRRYSKENIKKFLLVNFKINLFKEVKPLYWKYLETIRDTLQDSDYGFTTSELKFDKHRRVIEDDYIVLSPTSRHFTKTYPAEKFIEFVNSRGETKFVLVGDESQNDKMICDLIESNCKNVINLCGKPNMSELANVLFNSEYVICNDSAILHFSEALGKKVVAIFGSTVKEFGFFPQLNESIALEVKGLECRPCTHIGRDRCPLGHFKCMKEIQLTISS